MVRGTIVLSLLATAVGVWSKAASPIEQEAKIIPGSYVVEFDDAMDSVASVLDHFSAAGVETSRRLEFGLFNGVSIRFRDSRSARRDAAKMSTLAGVKNIWPNKLYHLPREEIIWKGESTLSRRPAAQRNGNWTTDDNYTPHVMTQIDQLRAKGIVGNGVKIGLVDCGIDYEHPALGGCFGPGCLVGYGTDLVGDAYTGSNDPVPDDDPYENCDGHGTHVAGIIAAQSNDYGFEGAAPGATLGMYRVFGCSGSAASDVLIDAFMQAYEDGSQIITASIAGASGWSQDPWAVAVSRIVEAGVPCTISAGNEGDMGMFFSSGAADGKGVTAVGSFNNQDITLLLTGSYYAVDAGESETFGYRVGSPGSWSNVSMQTWTPSYDIADPAAQACEPLPDDTPNLSPYIVLLRSGTCTIIEKALYASQKGAQYIMFYSEEPTGVDTPSALGVDGILAIGMTTAAQGEKWVSALGAGSTVLLQMVEPATAPTEVVTDRNNATGGFVSDYTSWSPTFEMDVKPQVAAPGGNILSTYPVGMGEYAILSGTSMACPIIASVLALIYEVRGTLDPSVVEPLLTAHARPQLLNDGSTTISPAVLAPVPQQGAGLVGAYDAAYSPVLLSTSSLVFNDTDNFIDTLEFTITNMADSDLTLTLGHVGAATGYTFPADQSSASTLFPDIFPGLDMTREFAALSFSAVSITIPGAGGKQTVSVTVTPPEDVDAKRLPIYSGYVTLNGTLSSAPGEGDGGEQDDNISLSLPYSGAVGSLNSVRVLGQTYVARSTDASLSPVPANTTFEMPAPDSPPPPINGTAGEYPMVVSRLAFGTAEFRVEVLSVPGSEVVGDLVGTPMRWVPRAPYYASWDGGLADGGDVAAGTYRLRVKALKIFGDREDEGERSWWVEETVPFTVKYI